MARGLVNVVLRRVTGYDVIRIALGVLLLTAAGLKAHQLATEPVLSTGLLDSRWLLMATVEFELLFGLWLLGNIWPKPTWAAALACFGLFAGVSLYKALSGHASCGCFGRVPVNPWYTATLDVAMVFLVATSSKCHRCCTMLRPGTGFLDSRLEMLFAFPGVIQ